MTFLDSISLTTWESVSEIGAVIVTVGVALEILDLVTKWKGHHHPKSILEKESTGPLFVESLSVILVVFGLVIEIYGTHRAMRLAREESDKLTTMAGQAIERAGKLEKEAADSRLKAAELEKEIQDANLKNSPIEAVTGLLIFDVDRDGMAWLNHRMFSITPGRKSFIDLYSQRFEAYVEIGLSSNIRTNNEIERSPIRLTTSLPPRYRDVDPEGHIERIIIQINGSEHSGRVGILDDLTNAMAAVRFNLSDGKVIRGYLGIKLNWWKTQWYSLSPHPELGEVGGSIFSGPALSSPPKIREISEL